MLNMKKILLIISLMSNLAIADNIVKQENIYLPPDEAFKVNLIKDSNTRLKIEWDISEGYYLYLGMFEFKTDNPEVQITKAIMPDGLKKTDEFFGEVDVYYDYTSALIEFDRIKPDAYIIVKYQGCADAGLCYPPITKKFRLDNFFSGDFSLQKTSMPNNQITISQQLAEKSIAFNIFLFFLAGILLAFTPCVFPMIPILTGLIVGQGNKISAKKSFLLSLTYVLSMALTYALAGVLISLSGSNVQANLQNPYVISSFAGLFVILSLSMFNIITIQMPRFIQNLILNKTNQNQSGTYIGVAIMGSLSALIVGPCVTAPLIGALIYISTTNDYILGGLALFSMGLGMGLPLLLLGTSASQLTKKIGPYLEITNKVFGVLFLVVSIWLIERIVSIQVAAYLWAILAFIMALYLYKTYIKFNAIKIAAKLTALLLFTYSVFQVYGINVNKNFDPIISFYEQKIDLNFIKVTNTEELFKEINNSTKIVMIDLYADWCVACKELDKYTFSDQRVSSVLKNVTLLKLDITETTDDNTEFLNEYKLFGPPALLFFDSVGNELESSRIVGFVDADTFLERFQTIDYKISQN